MPRTIYLLISTLLLFMQPGAAWCQALGSDHLVPLAGALTLGADEYSQTAALRQDLGLDSVRNPLALMVVQPSSTPAYALWVERASATTYWLEYRSTGPQLTQQHSSRATRFRQRLVLEPAVAQSLIDVVAVALAQAHYNNIRAIRGDGTAYRLINFESGVGWHSGEMWSPTTPAMSKLADIIEYTHQAASSTDSRAFSQASLLSKTRGLLLVLATH